jgi:hypothetical protein
MIVCQCTIWQEARRKSYSMIGLADADSFHKLDVYGREKILG